MTDSSSGGVARPAQHKPLDAVALHDGFEEHTIDQFRVTATGLFLDGESGSTKITADFVYLAGIGRDGGGKSWSSLFIFKNPDGAVSSKVIAHARFVNDWQGIIAELTDDGLICAPGYLRHLRTYMVLAGGYAGVGKFRLMKNVGVFPLNPAEPDGAFGYMRPNEAILPAGAQMEPAVFLPPYSSPLHRAYESAGDLASWREAVAPCANNDLWTFCLAIGFAGPLLEPGGIENFGVQLTGDSGSGKSTGGQIAVSAIGCAANPQLSTAPTLFQNWTSTANGIEAMAVAASGGILFLDDIGSMPKGVSLNVYAILNGRTKTRMTEYGGQRAQHGWRVLLLSTGEVTVRERIEAEEFRTVKAGELFRVLDIPLDRIPTEARLSQQEGDALANHLRTFLGECYGVAGEAFMRALFDSFPTLGELRAALHAEMDVRLEELRQALSARRPLMRAHNRALRNFALIYAAGVWAAEAEVSPIGKEQIGRAIIAMASAWQDGFPALTEQDALLESIRAYVSNHRSELRDSRDGPPPNYAGRPTLLVHDDKLWMSPDRFEAACGGLPFKRAAKMLDGLGVLWRHEGDGQHKVKLTLWPQLVQAARYYALRIERVFSAAELEALLSPPSDLGGPDGNESEVAAVAADPREDPRSPLRM